MSLMLTVRCGTLKLAPSKGIESALAPPCFYEIWYACIFTVYIYSTKFLSLFFYNHVLHMYHLFHNQPTSPWIFFTFPAFKYKDHKHKFCVPWKQVSYAQHTHKSCIIKYKERQIFGNHVLFLQHNINVPIFKRKIWTMYPHLLAYPWVKLSP
jgi:hypothetical protein